MAIINGQVISIAPETENIPITSTPDDDMTVWIDPNEDNADGWYTKKETDALIAEHSDNADIHVTASDKINWNGKAEAPKISTTLPTSGTALSDNTIYNVSASVGTYQFAPPSNGWSHGRFSTGTTVNITFASGSFVGAVPTFEGDKTYEFDVLYGAWAFAEVVTA